ncbi:MAG: MFS transporter [Commensalibacter sp.]|nr:MFS transporter [Commensalibacter sp.]
MSKNNVLNRNAYWSGVFSVTSCIFLLITSEFMPVSLLTPIAKDLAISEGMAGQGLTISGICAVIISLILPTIIGNIDRKILLLTMTAMMAFSGLIIAQATNYPVYMLGRALIGLVIGGFWSMSAAIAIRLVPQDKIAQALAIFNSGNALATTISAPLGSYMSALIGWRWAFFSLAPIAFVILAWQWVSLPKMPINKGNPATKITLSQILNPVVSMGLMACGLFFMGQFTLFTYIRPFLEKVTQVNVNTLSFILLIIGISGFIGTLVINKILQYDLYVLLITIPLIMAIIAIMLIGIGHYPIYTTILLAIWGFVATAAPVGWWVWVAKTFPNNAETGGGFMVAIIQFSIAFGSIIGGIAFDDIHWQANLILSAMILIMASTLIFRTSRQ